MLVNMTELLQDAQARKYAVGMFNATNLEMAMGILAAAEALRAPVILGPAEVLLSAAGLEELAAFLVPLAKRAKVPVAVHFDHGMTEEAIYRCIQLGFTSVMYDCSTDTFENNISRVAQLTRTAHHFGVSVEAELGHVGANQEAVEGDGMDHSIYTSPAQAGEFARATGVDALAVAIGNAHGVYLETPRLDLDVLRRIAASTPCPLVLHGGSGLSDEDFRACIREGICKINIFTDLNMAAAAYIAQHYRPGMGYSTLQPGVVKAVQGEVEKKIRLFGSQDKA